MEGAALTRSSEGVRFVNKSRPNLSHIIYIFVIPEADTGIYDDGRHSHPEDSRAVAQDGCSERGVLGKLVGSVLERLACDGIHAGGRDRAKDSCLLVADAVA